MAGFMAANLRECQPGASPQQERFLVAGRESAATIAVMGAARKLEQLSEADYLAGELLSPVKHEYLGGSVYAMAGARIGHNDIVMNVTKLLLQRMRRKHCRPFNSDTKVRVQLATHVRFYYPDLSVVCGPYSREASYHTAPSLLVEVTSRSTRRTDHGEKREAYLTIPSLEAYLIVESHERKITLWRRSGEGFSAEVYVDADAVVELDFLDVALPLDEVYEPGFLPAEPEDDEEPIS